MSGRMWPLDDEVVALEEEMEAVEDGTVVDRAAVVLLGNQIDALVADSSGSLVVVTVFCHVSIEKQHRLVMISPTILPLPLLLHLR